MQIDEAYAKLNIVQDLIPVGSSNRPGRAALDRKQRPGRSPHPRDNEKQGLTLAVLIQIVARQLSARRLCQPFVASLPNSTFAL
jgi:hypothetical protein